jgi:hypothetical protein
MMACDPQIPAEVNTYLASKLVDEGEHMVFVPLQASIQDLEHVRSMLTTGAREVTP